MGSLRIRRPTAGRFVKHLSGPLGLPPASVRSPWPDGPIGRNVGTGRPANVPPSRRAGLHGLLEARAGPEACDGMQLAGQGTHRCVVLLLLPGAVHAVSGLRGGLAGRHRATPACDFKGWRASERCATISRPVSKARDPAVLHMLLCIALCRRMRVAVR